MIFRFPNQTATRARASVAIVPALGVSSGPLPVPNHRNERGSIPSMARAWRTLGAPMMLPTALERVAPQTPRRMASPQKDIRRMIRGSETRGPRLPRQTRRRGTAM